MKRTVRDYGELSVIKRRIGHLVGARLREVDKIRMAMEKQDEIREGHPAPEGWDSVSAIRKWGYAPLERNHFWGQFRLTFWGQTPHL